MKEQLIISVGREFGSGGHEIAQKLADHYHLPLYDHNLLDEMAEKHGMDKELLKELDEKKRNKFLSRTVRGMSNSPEHNVAQLQFDFIKQKAEEGKSFVIVGRCSETVLHEHPAMISFFILGDMDVKIKRIMKLHQMSKSQAEALILEKDRKRKKYHNSHLDLADLIAEGSLGLMQAVDKYNPDLGYRFSTCATPWIKQAITKSIIDKGKNIRIPAHVYQLLSKYLHHHK